MFRYLLIISLLSGGSAIAGGGLYYSVGSASQQLQNSTQITTSLTSPASVSSSRDASRFNYTDFVLQLGYKARRRLTDRFYLAPEFQLSRLDGELQYATRLRAGSDMHDFSWNVSVGIARTDKFNANLLLYSIGMEWSISTKIGVYTEWQQFQTIREQTQSSGSFGSQTLVTTTDTRRKLSQLLLGVRFYLHE